MAKTPPTFELRSVEFRGPYAFIDVRVQWDDGEETRGGARIDLRLPIEASAAGSVETLRREAIALVRRVVDIEAIRAWRGRDSR